MKNEDGIRQAILRNICIYDSEEEKHLVISYKLLFLMLSYLGDELSYILCEKCPKKSDASGEAKILTMNNEELKVLEELKVHYPNNKTCYLIMVGKNGKTVAGAC